MDGARAFRRVGCCRATSARVYIAARGPRNKASGLAETAELRGRPRATIGGLGGHLQRQSCNVNHCVWGGFIHIPVTAYYMPIKCTVLWPRTPYRIGPIEFIGLRSTRRHCAQFYCGCLRDRRAGECVGARRSTQESLISFGTSLSGTWDTRTLRTCNTLARTLARLHAPN